MLIDSTYNSPFPVSNGHLETVVPYFLRKVSKLPFKRERIETVDHDFLDIDWLKKGSNKLVILSHGLEGCSTSNYILGLSHHLSKQGFDILAWNNRGCSGETNRLIKMYHSGASYDLREVINHVLKNNDYPEIYLAGFSMGGNITLKYLGEEGEDVNPRIKKAVAISTPISLADCADSLSNGFSRLYSRHFILQIIKKLKIKQSAIPEFTPDIKKLKKIWNFEAFDDEVTAPINGFKDAQDYWEKSSSFNFIPSIKVKSLVVNAKNDPFLKGRCYPFEMMKNHPFVDFETPERGGHVGFLEKGFSKVWFEERISNFLN